MWIKTGDVWFARKTHNLSMHHLLEHINQKPIRQCSRIECSRIEAQLLPDIEDTVYLVYYK